MSPRGTPQSKAALLAGSDVVDWLYHNVEGFTDRREARKYASNLLKAGFIRHTVNKITFSEQCYYIFGDLCGSMCLPPSLCSGWAWGGAHGYGSRLQGIQRRGRQGWAPSSRPENFVVEAEPSSGSAPALRLLEGPAFSKWLAPC